MASIVSAFSDAFIEKHSFLKIALYAIPVYITYNLFVAGNMAAYYIMAAITSSILFALMTVGINNVRENNREILTLNPLKLIFVFLKTLVVIVPHSLLWGWLGYMGITYCTATIQDTTVSLIFSIIIWVVVGTIPFTAYLAFAKYLDIRDGYNLQIIFMSCFDIFAALIFYVLQMAIVIPVIIGPFAYAYWLLHVPFNHWSFLVICSLAVVANVSISANYFAQVSYEYIVLSNDRKDDYQITKLVDEMDTNKN